MAEKRILDFIDLRSQQFRIAESLDSRIKTVLAHGQYIMGPEVGELEQNLAVYTAANTASLSPTAPMPCSSK
jgi:UDP-2-acetamido-2-deoxy-ribo-hexuluronate aminotransferase